VSITYTYDAGGRRVSRSDGLNTVYYVYDGLNLIEERDGLNNVLAEYIYDGALHPRKAIIGGNAYYFQQDVLGNVTALTDEDGEIVETYEYDIYGKPSIYDENGDPMATPMAPFLFTGHYWDADTGLYLTMYRAYSPELGRWLTRDPIDFNAGDVNLYRYTENDSINNMDYLGLAKKKNWEQIVSTVWTVGPVDAWEARNLGKSSYDNAKKTGLPGHGNGPQDAYRHCLWNCLMTRKIGIDQAKEVADIHEGTNLGPADEHEMDYCNNEIGRQLGLNNEKSCEDSCMDALSQELLKVLPKERWKE
jgi:RHS repeat-associated protein